MEDTLTKGFSELKDEELYAVDGGSIIGAVLFTAWGVKVTVGMCLSAGAAVGLVAGGAVVLKN